MKTIGKYFILLLVLAACSQNDDAGDVLGEPQTLAEMIAQGPVELEGVISCASGSENENEVIVYLYPRLGARNIRYFETATADVDPNDYENYTELEITTMDYFNGYLLQIKRQITTEKWVIVTFEEEGVLQVSNPIRLKHLTQNTQFRNGFHIGGTSGMPIFSWGNIATPFDAIYFQVVSDANDNLLSGTYTHEAIFQYYKTENVVLNITQGTPPDLVLGEEYNFTVLAVSEDNWVNLIGQKRFSF
ncbi:hypothetical protein POV27_02815 [Aureisphaera galaxeae]|uniref:hypothetical protein n=1 Tax=Aureisphaera galaxeae TaxID=1538023 RepID=UPI002350F2CD|nr:hypothetical protein [Aureisphaera galaxeae]MDC8002964.1 hypothetical protein [Aureisphaera galaxeae]